MRELAASLTHAGAKLELLVPETILVALLEKICAVFFTTCAATS